MSKDLNDGTSIIFIKKFKNGKDIKLKNNFVFNTSLLSINQLFAKKSLCKYYDNLKTMFTMSYSITRNKYMILPKHSKTIHNKRLYNSSPNKMKIIRIKI